MDNDVTWFLATANSMTDVRFFELGSHTFIASHLNAFLLYHISTGSLQDDGIIHE